MDFWLLFSHSVVLTQLVILVGRSHGLQYKSSKIQCQFFGHLSRGNLLTMMETQIVQLGCARTRHSFFRLRLRVDGPTIECVSSGKTGTQPLCIDRRRNSKQTGKWSPKYFLAALCRNTPTTGSLSIREVSISRYQARRLHGIMTIVWSYVLSLTTSTTAIME